MDKQTEETLLQAADYCNEEKACFTKRVRIVYIAGLAGMAVYMILDLLGLAEIQPYTSIVDAMLGLVTGALLTGLLYSSNYMTKLHAAKMRLFQHKNN